MQSHGILNWRKSPELYIPPIVCAFLAAAITLQVCWLFGWIARSDPYHPLAQLLFWLVNMLDLPTYRMEELLGIPGRYHATTLLAGTVNAFLGAVFGVVLGLIGKVIRHAVR